MFVPWEDGVLHEYEMHVGIKQWHRAHLVPQDGDSKAGNSRLEVCHETACSGGTSSTNSADNLAGGQSQAPEVCFLIVLLNEI